MSVHTANLIVATNEDLRAVIDFTDVEAAADFDFTATEMRMHVRKTAEELFVYLLLTTENDRIVITDAVVITLDVPQSVVVASLKPGEYVYDIIWTNDAGIVNLVSGKITVTLGVTRGDG